jgi:hypothetical protein
VIVAALLLVAQVETSSVVFTPERGAAYRAEAIRWRGEARDLSEELAEVRRQLASEQRASEEIEHFAITAPSCPPVEPPAWGGWPWVALFGGAALGAAAAAIIIGGPP